MSSGSNGRRMNERENPILLKTGIKNHLVFFCCYNCYINVREKLCFVRKG